MKRLVLCLSLIVLISGCVWGGSKPQMSQLQIREFQTRNFDTPDIKMVIKAVLNVLQDDGYSVKSADSNLGFIAATKEKSLGGYTWMSGKNSRWNASEVIEATVNVSQFEKQSRVRASFQRKVLDNFGAIVEADQIQGEKFYQDFFAKVDKGMFLQKEKL